LAQPVPAFDDDDDLPPSTIRELVGKDYSGWVAESAEGAWSPLNASEEELDGLGERLRVIAEELEQEEALSEGQKKTESES
jgi:hypothetical protein